MFHWWQGTNKATLVHQNRSVSWLLWFSPIGMIHIISQMCVAKPATLFCIFVCVRACVCATHLKWGTVRTDLKRTALRSCILITRREHSKQHNGWRVGWRVAVLNPYTADLANCGLNRVPLNSAVPTFKQRHTWHALICRRFTIFDV